LKEWGTPTTPADLSNLFTAYLRALPSTPTTPFCDLPLSPESTTILPHLLALNSPDMHHWTVGSQPAVDSARSDDAVHGWGPTGGYVFQKAFVEFFVPAQEVERLEERLKRTNNEQISMYAANKAVSNSRGYVFPHQHTSRQAVSWRCRRLESYSYGWTIRARSRR
jgi:methylenetetrahydrofolate reductase (NADPH)